MKLSVSNLEIKAINSQEATIYLYGAIGAWEEVNANDFTRIFNEAVKLYSKINLRINSPGGEVGEGFAIYNLIESAGVDVDVYIDGIAASMATVLMLTGKKVYVAKNALIMIHSPSNIVLGNSKDMEEMAKYLQKLEAQFSDLYAGRTGKDKKWIADNWMDGKDHWFTAEEAVEAGLAHEIFNSKTAAPKDTGNLSKIAAHYLSGKPPASEPPKPDNKPNKHNMKFLISLLNTHKGISLTADASEAQVEAAVKQVIEDQKSKEQEIQNLIAAKKALEQQIKDAAEQALKDKATALIDQAVADKKILGGEKEGYLKLASTEDGFEAVKTILDAKKGHAPVAPTLSDTGGEETKAQLIAAYKKANEEGTLEEIKANEPERWKLIYKAKFNKDWKD
jgi:ATP-dependent Clp endopeptidase proteolytic subunit ClpP